MLSPRLAGEFLGDSHRELYAVLRLRAQSLGLYPRLAHGVYRVVYCIDEDADIFKKLYDPRLLRGLVLQNRVDEPLGLRDVERSLYHRVCGGVQLVRIFYSEQSAGVSFG